MNNNGNRKVSWPKKIWARTVEIFGKNNDNDVVKNQSYQESLGYYRDFSNRRFSTDDLYRALDYPEKISYKDYVKKFKRQDIANRIVKSPVEGSWREEPEIQDLIDDNTKFEKDFKNIENDLNLYPILQKLDLLATLGRYSVLFIGFNDETDLSLQVGNASSISYLKAIPEDNAVIQTWEKDRTSERYGQPKTYSVQISTDMGTQTRITVHWSRLLHVAENTLESDIYGNPCLQSVYNRLLGLDKLSGGSPEMYWRGARPGYVAQSTSGGVFTPAQLKNFREELTYFASDMQRTMVAQGLEIASLAPQVVSPKEHVDVQLQLISAATKIPLRILIGSERGELASSQDERAWLTYLEERREQVIENLILKPFIDRLIDFGTITAPNEGKYLIQWPPLVVKSQKEKVEIALLTMQAVKTWSESLGAQDIFNHEYLLKELGKSDDEIQLQLKSAMETLIEEDLERKKPENVKPEDNENDEDDKDETPIEDDVKE